MIFLSSLVAIIIIIRDYYSVEVRAIMSHFESGRRSESVWVVFG